MSRPRWPDSHQPPSREPGTVQTALFVAVAVVLAIETRSGIGRIPVNDFLEYWAAARLTLNGENPYSQSGMFQLESSTNELPSDKPLMMWNPPFVLPFILPFGMMPLATARAVMGVVAFAMIFLSAECSWQYYGGDIRSRWVVWLVAAAFAPVFAAIASGQVSPWVLVGVTAFLWCEHRRKYFWSGVALVPMALKPHLLYLVWIAVGMWILEGRRWRVIAGAATGLLIALTGAFLADGNVFEHYIGALQTESMLALYAPPLGGLLRVAFGWQRYWLQFAPSALGIGWLIWRRVLWAEFDAIREFPLLLLISICTSPYGWLFDQVVLIPAVAQRAAQIVASRTTDGRVWLWVTTWFAANVICLVQIIRSGTMLSLSFLWVAPFYLAMYAFTGRSSTHHLTHVSRL